MTGTSTYIVTYLDADKPLEVGPQHIRQSYEAAVEVATDLAIQKDEGLDRETVEAELTEFAFYESNDGDWSVVIGNPDTED